MNIKALLFIFSCTTLTVQAQQEDFGQDALINPSAATFNFDIASGPIEPTDESIAAHYQCPEWFRNAKFGIYMQGSQLRPGARRSLRQVDVLVSGTGFLPAQTSDIRLQGACA